MRTATLILAHKNPRQLARLCAALRHPGHTVFVHLDAKADMGLYGDAARQGGIFIRGRVNVSWGGFSMVEATLDSLGEILESGASFDYLHLISGQDYPVAPLTAIHSQLERAGGRNFIAFRELDEADPADLLLTARYRHYHIETGSRPLRSLVKAANRLGGIRREPPLRPVYKGSQWFTLTRDCVDHIVRFCRTEPAYLKFFRRAACSDEMFFHTIVLHGPYARTVENCNKRYIKWTEGKPNPEVLSIRDYPLMTAGEYWFARKFEEDDPVLDMLDDHVFK